MKNKGTSKFIIFIFFAFIGISVFTCTSQHRVGCHCWDGSESSATGRGA